jgi:DNA-3-methyladenine glycosylase II
VTDPAPSDDTASAPPGDAASAPSDDAASDDAGRADDGAGPDEGAAFDAGTDADGAAATPHDYLRETALAPLVDRYGELTVEPADDPFRRFVVSIVNQQLSSASAAAVRGRLFAALDDEVTPARVLAADESTLRDAGLSAAKVDYVRNAARAFEDGLLEPARFVGVDDEAVLEAVTAVRGVGAWTGKMYLLFGLGREDVFPVEDLGIRGGMADLFDVDRGDRAAMVDRADPWRPYRSYASLYLWHHYEDGETDVGGTD